MWDSILTDSAHCVLQRNDASEHIKTIGLFAGSVILGGALFPTWTCDKEQEH